MKKDSKLRLVDQHLLGKMIARARARRRALELFCPKDFHRYEGVDVCLLFCRKKVCPVYNALKSEKEWVEVGAGLLDRLGSERGSRSEKRRRHKRTRAPFIEKVI